MIVNERLDSTSKDIILIREDDNQEYTDAQNVCKHICGKIYFPSSLEENLDVEDVLDKGYRNYRSYATHFSDDVWLRIVYNNTIGNWTDPENKETLTFRNFYYDDVLASFPWCMNATHVRMDYIGDWMPSCGTHSVDEYVLCELT